MAVAPLPVDEGFAGPGEHLAAELARLDLMVEREVQRMRLPNIFGSGNGVRAAYPPDDFTEEPDAESPLDASIAARLRENESRARRSPAGSLPLRTLEERIGLSRQEIDLLIVAAAPHLDSRYARVYSLLQDGAAARLPTVALAAGLVGYDSEVGPAQARALLGPDARLPEHGLLSTSHEGSEYLVPFHARTLMVDDRVVDFLLGRDVTDARLRGVARTTPAGRPITELCVPDELKAALAGLADRLTKDRPCCVFRGRPGVGKRAAVRAICDRAGLDLLEVETPTLGGDLDGLLRLVRREAELCGSAVYLARFDARATDEFGLALPILECIPTPLFLGCGPDAPIPSLYSDSRAVLSFDLPLQDYPARLRLWTEQLGSSGGRGNLPLVAAVFELSAGQIDAAAHEAKLRARIRGATRARVSRADLHQAARAQSNQGLSRLTRKIEPAYGWDDVVLPHRVLRLLRELCAAVRNRHLVSSEWGLDPELSRGTGITALFAGPSGTGKTMATEIVARDLDLDLYRIDLATVVSKYIGETERNLSRIFGEAATSNAILFFDEAEALFGKRSEVRDSHDRYANIEVAYLLQEMEAYAGLAILATNLSENLDEAFARRVTFRVDFPFPDACQRERIWKRMFPPQVPLASDVPLAELARRFELTGGGIRNAALFAAFAAADAGTEIGTRELVEAIRCEYEKRGKLASQAEFGAFHPLLGD